ncbi:MAG: GtrA family protein [Acidimicrobiales bacterium]
MLQTRLRDRPLVTKLLRYSLASLAGTIAGQGSLYAFVNVADWSAVPANLTAVTIGAIPNYLINRYWTWNKRGRNHLLGEVVPFWVMTILGLLISTLFVAYAEDHWDAKWTINAASMAGFGVLWVAKFVILDRLLFATRDPDPDPNPDPDPDPDPNVGALGTS